MKRCPECGEPLFRRRFESLELDGCRSCGGVWFDGGELATAAREHPDALREADRFFREGLQPSLQPKRSDDCPSCASTLREGEHPAFPSIAMRLCGHCQGVFLPEGSGAALTKRLTGEPPLAATPNEPKDEVPPRSAEARPAPVADPTSTAHLPLVRGALITRDVHHSSGFVESLTRALTFMGAAFRLGREQPRLLIPTAIGVALNVVVAIVMVVFVVLLVPLGGGEATAHALDENGGVLGIGIVILTTVGHVFSWATMGMTVSAVDAYMKGQPIDVGVAFRDVMKNIVGIVILSIVSMIVESITSSLRRRRRGLGGLFVSMAASAIDAAWTTLSFLLLPVIMIEDIGLFAALARVRAIHRQNFLTIAASEIGIRLVTGIGAFVIVGVFAGLFALLRPESVAVWATFITLAVVVGLAFNALAVFLRATYYTCLYLWAAAVEASPDARQLRVPGPIAQAFT